MNNNKGFSLIEITIAIVIMGVLVLGVIGGVTLINSSKMSSTSAQMNEYATNSNTFYLKYNALPGDFNRATTVFGASDRAGHAVHDGNGDGLIGSSNYLDQESLSFFQHLYAASILENIYTGAMPTNDSQIMSGDIYPISKLSKDTFYYIRSDDMSMRYERTNNLALRSLSTGNTTNDVKLLYAFDKKFDDGRPLTGKIIAAPL